MIINSEQAAHHLTSGGLLIYPTDTVYGIGCIPSKETALRNLLSVKPRKSGFIVLIDSWEKYQSWIDETINLSELEASSPTTWVFKASDRVPKPIQRSGMIAIRKVNYTPTLKLLSKLDEPLLSTSANYPGKETPSQISDLENLFPYPILEGNPGGEQPSTIIVYKTKEVLR